MYLIVPPIIIILAIAILIVFLARVLSSKDRVNKKSQPVDEKTGVKDTLKKSKSFFKNKGTKTSKRIKKTLQSTHKVKSKSKKYNGDSIMTQGITTDETIENVVSLCKKSMISDKLESDEKRDEKELKLMKEIEEDPKNSKKYEILGDYYMEQEKFEDARDCYKYVLRLDPRHKRAQVAMKNLDRVL
jgi:tetratricopeptide (TPR) repeat protein